MRRLLPLIVVFTFLSTGCATIYDRAPGGLHYPGTYPATRLDAEMLRDLYRNPLHGPPPFLWPLYWALYTPFIVLDFAPSVITDTVMLPFDLHDSRTKEDEQKERVQPADQDHGVEKALSHQPDQPPSPEPRVPRGGPSPLPIP